MGQCRCAREPHWLGWGQAGLNRQGWETNFPRTVDGRLPRRHGNHLRIVVFLSFTRRGGDSRVCPYGATTNARNVATTTQSLTMEMAKYKLSRDITASVVIGAIH